MPANRQVETRTDFQEEKQKRTIEQTPIEERIFAAKGPGTPIELARRQR
jgi:hypothetical protein